MTASLLSSSLPELDSSAAAELELAAALDMELEDEAMTAVARVVLGAETEMTVVTGSSAADSVSGFAATLDGARTAVVTAASAVLTGTETALEWE